MSQMSRNTGSNVAQSAQYCEQSFKMTSSTHQGYTLGNKSSRWENEAIAQKCATLEQPQWKDDSFTIFHSTSLKKVEPTKKRDTVDNQLHFIAGGLAGCAATTVTCPIDVIKTRQQSSNSVGNPQQTKLSFPSSTPKGSNVRLMTSFARSSLHNTYHSSVAQPSLSVHKGSILQHCRYILQVEGGKAFFKGLGIGLLGSVPSRALYFHFYNATKVTLTTNFGYTPNSMSTSMIASFAGGLVATTATSPLWVVKTKQQLHRRLNNTSLSCWECAKQVGRAEGWRGFYRGLSASYAGILETVIYFTIYEQMKEQYMKKHGLDITCTSNSMSSLWELPGLMVLSSTSKCIATSFTYPFEVVRTRLREEAVQKRYNGFFQTIRDVARTEGRKGLYAGLPAQLFRQVPNMAILMGVYEAVIYLGQH